MPNSDGKISKYEQNGRIKLLGGTLEHFPDLFRTGDTDPTQPQPQSFTQYIVSPQKVNGVWTLQSTTSTGAVYPLRAFGPTEIWLIGNIGVTITASSNAKLGTVLGALDTYRNKAGWIFAAGAEWVSGTRTYVAAVLKSF